MSAFPPLPGVRNKPPPQEIILDSGSFDKIQSTESDKRETTPVSEVIKILSKYKNSYLRKKNDTIRKVIKTIQLKTKESDPLISYLSDLRILAAKEID